MGDRDVHEKQGNGSLKVGDAVGVKRQNWYVAIVNNNSEKNYADKLQKLGYESYVPIQREERKWRNGKINTVDKVILPSVVFVRVTESERLTEVAKLPYIKRFMVDISRGKDQYGKHPIAKIPNCEIERLRLMLKNAKSPVSIESIPYHLGDKVKIANGKLQGLEGFIVKCIDNSIYFIISLSVFGCVKVKLSMQDIELIEETENIKLKNKNCLCPK